MKTFKQFSAESNFNQAKEVADNEKNFAHSFNKPGHRAHNYSYAGKRAPDKNDPTKEVPREVRHTQDLKAAQERSRQRQVK
tara:strand:+ start:1231 stop:1473 length:243 start_codon:yes stop_codon:yes gene_type:complete